MIAKGKGAIHSRKRQIIAEVAIAIAVAVLAVILISPFIARPAYADESLRHTECPSSTQQSITVSAPDFGMMSGIEGIEPIGHSDDCQH